MLGIYTNLESGGGGNFGREFSVPNTSLKDYMSRSGLKIEYLSRAFLDKDHNSTKKFFAGYGLYGFILFRDRGSYDFERKNRVTQAFLSILPDFTTDSFGVSRINSGVLIYPTTLTDEELYQGFNAGGFDGVDDRTAITKNYNYSYSLYALKKIRSQKNIDLPSISLVFVPSSAELDNNKFYLSNFNWSDAIIFDISKEEDYISFFNDLNNYFVYDINIKSFDLFGNVRRFAESTGRLALIVFE